MTHTKDNYSALRERINELLPERLKLEFGVQVDRGAGEQVHEFIAGMFNDRIAIVRITEVGAWLPFEVPRDLEHGWKILGKPIDLSDVLHALNNMLAILDGMGNLYILRPRLSDKHVKIDQPPVCKFNLTLPLSDPANSSACGEVLKLLQ